MPVHSDRGPMFVEPIKASFPDMEVAVCDSYAGVGEALRATEPEIVLSHKFEDAVYPGRMITDALSVRWIHCGGTGVDHFDPWDPLRITITNSPGVASKVMSEYALGAIYARSTSTSRSTCAGSSAMNGVAAPSGRPKAARLR